MPLPHRSDALDVLLRQQPALSAAESHQPAPDAPGRSRGRKRAGDLATRTIQACDLDAGDIAAWRELYNREGRLPFESPECLLTWTSHHDLHRRRTSVLYVYEIDTLVAVIPLHRQRLTPLGGTRLIMPGADQAAAVIEIPAALIASGTERRVWRAAIEHLMQGRRTWNWLQLSLHDFLTFEPDWLPADRASVAVPLMTRTSVVVRHDEAPAMSRNLKESLRRSRNRLNRDFGTDWSLKRLTDAQQVMDGYARLIGNHQSRANMEGRRAHHDVLSDPRDEATLADLVRTFGVDGRSTIYELTVHDRCFASLLVLSCPHSSYILLTGMTEKAWPYSPLTLLTAAAVNDSAQRGEDELRLPTGADTAKLRWSRTLARHEEFAVVGSRLRDQLAFTCYDQVRAWRRLRRLRRSAAKRSGEPLAAR
jgi:CelD/BcsL family acetyltransferase involved in cellulose biosynthesis